MVLHKSFWGGIVLRSTIFGLGIAVAAIILVPSAANAQDIYTPRTPTAPSLSGSTAIAECAGDVPWINFSVGLIDPDNQSTGHTASLYMTDGTHETTVPLGVLNGNSLSNRVLWPGASVDGAGNGTGWPGWELVNGTWAETSGNFAWTRGAITAEIRVNPSLTVPLTYPPASAKCVKPPTSIGFPLTDEPGLATTGGAIPVLAIGLGAAAIALGGTMLIKRRQHKH